MRTSPVAGPFPGGSNSAGRGVPRATEPPDGYRPPRRRKRSIAVEIISWILVALLLFYVVHSHTRGTTGASTAIAAIGALLIVPAVAIILHRFGGRRATPPAGYPTPALSALEGVTDPSLSFLPVDELLTTLMDRTLRAVGGDVISVLLLTGDRNRLYVRAHRGDPDLIPNGPALSLGDGILGSTAQWSRPVVVEEVSESGVRRVEGAHNVGSLMAAPLMARGAAIGVIEVGRKDRRRFEQKDVRLLQVVADRCALVIEQARLGESERRSRLGAVHARLHLDVLARTGVVLAQALDSYDEALEQLASILVPDFADWIAVDVVDGPGRLRRVATAAVGHSFGVVPQGHPDGDQLVQLSMAERRPQVVMNTSRIGATDIDSSIHPAYRGDSGAPDIDSMLVVPIKVRDGFIGALSFVTGPGRRGYRPSDLKTARELADRVGVAIERVTSWQESQVAGNAALGYAQRLQKLVEAGLVVNAQLAEEEVLELLAEHAHRVLGAETVVISARPAGGQLFEKIWPPPPSSQSKSEPDMRSTVSAACDALARTGVPRREPDGSPRGPDEPPATAASTSRPTYATPWMAVPITGPEGECTRAVVALGAPGRSFTADDESVLTLLAQMASVALQNAQLYADVRSNERRLQAVVEASPLAIAELDLAGEARWWNRAAGELFGWGETAGPHRVTVREGSELVLAELWERARGGNATIGVAMSSNGPDGEQLELSVSTSPLGEQGRATGMLLVVDDVTEWRRILDQFHQAERLGAMTRMAGAVAHDFNNLLTVILGCSEVLMQRLDHDDGLAQEVSAIQRAGSRAAALTSQLVGIGQQRPVQPEVVDVDEVVVSMQPMVAGVLGEGVTLDLVRGAGPAKILIDRSELERSILNLAINARDAMPDGGRFVVQTSCTTTGLSDDDDSRSVQISFQDTGTGIEPETLAHCFEPFFTTKGRAQGTGLGLATVHATVTKAGGDIRVESTPGQGTKFTMVFALHEGDDPEPELTGNGALETVPSPGGKVVMFVDDEPEVLRLAVSELERRGYTVIGAGNGSQALSAINARNGQIDLLVTDVVMPGMSGIELAEAVTKRYARLPVLFVSGHLDEHVATSHPLPDDAQLVSKPFTPDELSTRVLQALSKPKTGRTRKVRKGAQSKGAKAAVPSRRVS